MARVQKAADKILRDLHESVYFTAPEEFEAFNAIVEQALTDPESLPFLIAAEGLSGDLVNQWVRDALIESY